MSAASRSLRWLAAGAAGAAALHTVPSVVALGQWTPARALPRRWCTWRGPRVPRVALTFDDGPDPVTTPKVLDTLDALGLVATFFLLGSRVRAHPEVVDHIAARGHEIALHGDRHDHHFARSPAWVLADLDAALAALAQCGQRPRWYRPPYGQATGGTLLASRIRRVPMVLWSAWGREWSAGTASAVTARVTAALDPGAVVLLHDSDVLSPAGTTDRVLAALGPIKDALDARGLGSATLSELLVA